MDNNHLLHTENKEARRMKKIIIPFDGSDYSIRAMEKGVELANILGGEIVVINAIEHLAYNEEKTNKLVAADSLKDYSEKILQDGKSVMERLGFTNYKLESVIDEPTNAICGYAKRNGMDLIIMGSQGMNAGKFRGIFIGSITRKVISCTDLPVLVVK